MLEVIEGKPPLPRWFPPYEHGLFATAPQLGWEAPHGARHASGEPEPDARQQRRDAGERAAHPRPRRRLVPLDGHRGVAGHGRRHRRRRRRRPRRRRGRARHAAAGGDRRRRQRRRTGAHRQGRVLRRRQPGRHRRRARHPGELRGLRCDRQRHGRRRVHRVRRHRVHGRRRLPVVALPVDRVVRAVPAVQDRLGRDHQRTSSASRPAPATTTTSR